VNKNTRIAIATQLRRVLETHDAEVFIDDLHKGGALASWHSAKGKLSPAVFPGVNPYHHHKATSYHTSFAAMVEHLDRIGAAIVDGHAFVAA
jgi:hypothetical protein